MQGWWGIQDQWGIHMVCIPHMDCLWCRVDIHSGLCELLCYKVHWCHTAERDMDLGTLSVCMRLPIGIHCHSYNQLQKASVYQHNVINVCRPTTILTFFTNFVGITNITYPANTGGPVSSCFAFGIYSTRASEAWVCAFFSKACKMIGAFRISCAFWASCCKKDVVLSKPIVAYIINP